MAKSTLCCEVPCYCVASGGGLGHASDASKPIHAHAPGPSPMMGPPHGGYVAPQQPSAFPHGMGQYQSGRPASLGMPQQPHPYAFGGQMQQTYQGAEDLAFSGVPDGTKFKAALIDDIKLFLSPKWKVGLINKEMHKIIKTIAKKVVDKVMYSFYNSPVPQTQEEIDKYL